MVSSSSRLHADLRFKLLAGDFGAPDVERRGSRKRRTARMIDWIKIIDVLRAFRIGIIRLLAPDVNCSISAVDMPPVDGPDLPMNDK